MSMDYQKIFFKLVFLSHILIDNSFAIENYGAYIPPMCYTKTKQNGMSTNPCYVCHTNGKEPNYFNELVLQQQYLFPKKMMENPYKNLFIDRKSDINKISDKKMSAYIRQNNYSKALEAEYGCYFNFDDEGFDRDNRGVYTLWRAFKYKPFMGTFFPTNGSFDDVMIRLPQIFALDNHGRFSKEIYKYNLDVVVHNIKARDVNKRAYVAKAAQIKSDFGLYPVGTQFLHTVRYIDFVNGAPVGSKRLKELRYGEKVAYKNYSQLESLAEKEFYEEPDQYGLPPIQSYSYDSKRGFDNKMGWFYRGYIEDFDGALRKQTQEEALSCIGCHAKLGATVDSTFALRRHAGWGYQNLKKMGDMEGEYKRYLLHNPTGNEYGTNDEVVRKFFNPDKSIKKEMFDKLSKEITVLLFPSRKRAMCLNKGYYLLVQHQSYIYGKEAPLQPIKNVHRSIKNSDTGIKKVIVNHFK
jgi:hypothetical protein